MVRGRPLNLAANCLDRHLQENGDRTAIIWEGDDGSQSKHISYKELHRDVCRFANTLLELGIKKGDVVAIYMPMGRKPRLRCWPAPALARCIR